jgi:hypothetical protein
MPNGSGDFLSLIQINREHGYLSQLNVQSFTKPSLD